MTGDGHAKTPTAEKEGENLIRLKLGKDGMIKPKLNEHG